MNNGLEIAIIGLAGKFPGAKDATEYWHNLLQGTESIHFYARTELTQDVEQDWQNMPNFVNAGGKLADIDLFDGSFFGFSPKEAEIIDPQHRLFLETAWTALENAGYDSEQYNGSIGVFGGAGMNGYQFNLFRNPDITQSTSKYELFLASEKDFLTTRVSYKLNLEGPSVNVQTACSTSLVAVHLACQNLLSGECDMALAGGVAISLATGYLHQEGGIYSPDGHCKAFADDAGGTVGGSGVGIVVLKRLEDAISDKDNILAVIKGSAIDNDGALKVSYTAPRIDTQAKVIRAAQLVGEVEPETISYIEAHGTGTSLGDPIEIAALTQAFREETDSKQFCAIGSVKTNIGHLDAAAGIASLIKTVLALQHKQIPPSLNCDTPNQKIDWANSPFFVNRELKEWNSNGVRRAGVSSFGIGGTNAHVVLEAWEQGALDAEGAEGAGEAGEAGVQRCGGVPHVLVISAKTEIALDTATANLIVHLKQNPNLDLTDVAYTLQVGRKAFNHRRMVVCEELKDAIEQLESKQVHSNNIEAGYKPVVFMFSGQGSQYVGMAEQLYHTEPVFKEKCDRCFQILEQYLDTSLKEIIFPSHKLYRRFGETSLYAPLINQTQYAQPAIFTIEYALAQLFIHWGIKPEATIGHSIGEYVAATLAEVFSLEDALKLVATRARLMQQQPSGVMLSVAMSANDVETQYIASSQDKLSIAVVNTPELCVVSGTEDSITELENTLTERGIACRRLKTSHGFHSYLMEGAVKPFIEAVKQVELHPPQIPFISNVTGNWISDTEATNPEYWGQQIRATVQFAKGIETITAESDCILLEVGAGKTLTTLAKQISSQNTILSSIPHIKQKSIAKGDRSFILNTCGQLWLSGIKFNWTNFYPEQPYRLPLPTYPFERKRYWVEAQTELIATNNIVNNQKIIIDNWFYIPSWSRDLPISQIDSKELTKTTHSWLIFQDDLEIGKSISDKLNNTECQIITVTRDSSFSTKIERFITINPQDSSHYFQLFDYLNEVNIITERIVYLWEINEDITKNNEVEKTFTQLLFLAQALGKQQINKNISIDVITSNLFDINGREKIKRNRSTVTGIIKVIDQEYSNINVYLRDIEFKLNPDYLLSEIVSHTRNLITAYRGNYRWLPEYKSYPIKSSENTLLQQQDVYLIVGDIERGLGKVWAEYLAREWQAKLILIDRDATNLKLDITAERELSRFDLDINNEVDLRNAIVKIQQDYPQINGVFFSTPMTNKNSASLMQEMNLNHWQYNYETKIKPIQIIDKCLQDIPLNFVCIQSSLSSVLGGIGLAAYASANAYLDTFVEQKNNEANNNIPWFSINWDAYQKETTDNSKGIGTSLQEYSLTPEEVGKATARVLSIQAGSQIVVSKGNLPARIEQWLTSSIAKNTNNKSEVNNITKHSRPNLAQKYIAPRNETEQEIAMIWQQVLGIDKVGIYDPFFELGGHSLLAIQTISRIRESFQIELPMSSILADTPTVANLAETISKQQPQAEEMAIIGQLLDEVTNLSPEEIAEQLNSQNAEK